MNNQTVSLPCELSITKPYPKSIRHAQPMLYMVLYAIARPTGDAHMFIKYAEFIACEREMHVHVRAVLHIMQKGRSLDSQQTIIT